MKNNFFAHDTVFIDKNVKIGNDTRIWHFSHIQSGSRIGKSCTLGQNVNIGQNVKVGDYAKIQNNVSVYEGVTLEDYVFCGPSIVFTNVKFPRAEFPEENKQNYLKTLVKKSATIGANSTIICGNTIGRYSIIGAGSVVTCDVPDFSLVFGNPAKFSHWVDCRGNKLVFNTNGISKCKKFYFDGKKVAELKN